MSDIDDELLDVAFYSLEHGILPPHYTPPTKEEIAEFLDPLLRNPPW